ncbi:phosphatidylinositol-4-phosphate 5-kinase [Pelomyxa schiedti]|nr:phosphatidylinositol-4-phosphate 5-kinase [Pelomyxa schiedti]
MVVDDTSVVPGGGATYTGRVVDGKPDGSGTAKWPNGGTYYGVWLNGDRTGRGVYKWHDGATREGECLNNKTDGWGVEHCADGSWYEGLWRDDHLKRGTWHDSNGVDVWDGEWVWNATANGHEMQGWGVQRRAAKGGATGAMVTVYEGEWDRHQWHGVGTWKSPDGSGDIYHGQFDHGKKCGTGSILFGGGGGNNSKDGSYVGEWKDDVFHGRGVRLWANGDRYDGQWVGGKEHGEGTKTWSRDGSSFTGLWEGGVPTKGTKRWPNGDMFEGTFTQKGCRGGEGVATLSSSSSPSSFNLKGTLNNNNVFQGASHPGVQHQMGSSQFEHCQLIEKLKKEFTKEKSELEAKQKEEMKAAKKEWEVKRNNEQHSEQLNQVKKNLQQLQEKLQKTQEEEDDERKSVLASHPELREAFESAKLLQSHLVTFASEFVLLDESVKKLNDSLQRATESNEELASHLKKLTELKGTLVMKLNESDSACKKLLGQTLTVQNSEPEIQECARNISRLTKKVWGIKSSTLTSTTSEMEMVPKEEAEGDHDNTVDGILMKPLLTVNDPQPHTFTPPFQLLCTLSDTLAQLQRCHFDECTKLADKHTVLSKELVEQVSVGGTLQKAIEETQRECSELQREHKGKWRLQRGLEGDEKFIGMPCVWSQLSELLPQAQQAIVELSLSKARLSSSACFGGSQQQQQPRLPSMTTASTAAGGTTLPGCTATTSSVSPVLLSSVPNCNNNESNLCVECEERPPDVQLQPCGHVVLCSQCAAVMKKCPHCRTFIKDKIHL